MIKKILILLVCILMLGGCSNTIQKKKKKEVVSKDVLGQLEYEVIQAPDYNTDEEGKNLTCTIEIKMEDYLLVKLENNSDVCYSKVTYEANGNNGIFEYVAGNSTVYSLVKVENSRECKEVNITNYEVSDLWYLDASQYVTLNQICETENKILGNFEYDMTNYRIYMKYIVVYNHTYVSDTIITQVYLEDVNDLYAKEVEEVEPVILYADCNSLGYVQLFNHKANYRISDFGMYELYPEYIIMIEDNSIEK